MSFLKIITGIDLILRMIERHRSRKEEGKHPSGNDVDTAIRIDGNDSPLRAEAVYQALEEVKSEMEYEHFSRQELACRCCGEMKMSPEFMVKIVALRKELGFPFIVTSAYRCPAHNMTVSSSGLNGPHTTGRAIDISVRGRDALRLLEAALSSHQFTGVGVQQKGGGRFVHLDDITGPTRPAIWSY